MWDTGDHRQWPLSHKSMYGGVDKGYRSYSMNALALISAAPPRVANSGPVYFIFCALALILSGDPWNFIQSLTTFVTKSLIFCNSKVQFDSPALLSARSVLNLFGRFESSRFQIILLDLDPPNKNNYVRILLYM